MLPNRERLARLKKVPDQHCIWCLEENVITVDDREHLPHCGASREVTDRMLRCIADQVTGLTAQMIANIDLKLSQSVELPIICLLATCLGHVWGERAAGKRANLAILRGELLDRVRLLGLARRRHYTLHNAKVLLENWINQYFL